MPLGGRRKSSFPVERFIVAEAIKHYHVCQTSRFASSRAARHLLTPWFDLYFGYGFAESGGWAASNHLAHFFRTMKRAAWKSRARDGRKKLLSLLWPEKPYGTISLIGWLWLTVFVVSNCSCECLLGPIHIVLSVVSVSPSPSLCRYSDLSISLKFVLVACHSILSDIAFFINWFRTVNAHFECGTCNR